MAQRGSTSGGLWYGRGLSSMAMSTRMIFTSTLSTSFAVPHTVMCRTVELSTKTGAQCACGKFSVDAASLKVKTMQLGEVRQIVASGYKLAHGSPLGSITWK